MSTTEGPNGWHRKPLKQAMNFVQRSQIDIIIDVLVVVGVILVEQTPGFLTLAFDAYPILFIGYLIAVVLLPRESVYAMQLKTFLSTGHDLLRNLGFVTAGMIIGIFGGLIVREKYGLNSVQTLQIVGLWSVLGIAAHVWAIRSVLRHPPKSNVSSWLANLPFYWIAMVALVHENYCYELLAIGQKYNTPLISFLYVLLFTTLIYLPVRMHSLIRAPRSISNWLWFGLTCTFLSLWGIFRIG